MITMQRLHLGADHGDRSPWTLLVVLTVAYMLLALSAYELFGALTIGVTFFPPAGMTFAAFLLLPQRRWPQIAAAIVIGEVLVDVGQGHGLGWSLGWAAANLAEPFLGAAVARSISPQVELTRRFAFSFVVGGLLVGPAVGASIGATVLAVADDMSWLSSHPSVWVGDALGVLVIAPCIIVLARPDATAPTVVRRIDPLLILLAMVGAGVLLFRSTSVPAGYAVLPLLALVALRYGAREVAAAGVVVATSLTAATAHGRGPWAAATVADAHDNLFQQQAFLLLAIVGAWLLKLEVRERVLAVHAAQRAEAQLDWARVRAREQRHLAAMNEALGALASAATTAEVETAAVEHGRALFDADSIVVLVEDLTSDVSSTRQPGDAARFSLLGEPVDPWAISLSDVLRTGLPVFDDREQADVADDRPRMAMLPFSVGRTRRGVIGITRPTGMEWSEGAQVRAIAFASIVGDALERTEQAATDRTIALTLQHALTPDRIDAPPGMLVAGRYLPATESLEIGGDWFELVPTDEGRAATAIIGDVVGHSLQAAAAMGKLAAAARALGYARLEPGALLDVLDLVAQHTPDAMMTTMACAVVRVDLAVVDYSVAGHPPPLLLDPDTGVRRLDGGRGRPLAIPPFGARRTCREQVVDGSMLLLYTDGLVERRGESIDVGLDRLAAVFADAAGLDPDAACDLVIDRMLGAGGNADDVAMLCVCIGPTQCAGQDDC